MRIVCPQCGYSRDIPSDKVPTRSSMATCPKCQFRFRFRVPGPAPVQEDPADEPAYPPRPSRPAPVREPAGQPQPFEPRTSRIYQSDPLAVPEDHGPPPRPQARWLPDPEPGSEPVFQAPPRPARLRERREEPPVWQPREGSPDEPASPSESRSGKSHPWETSPGQPEPRPDARTLYGIEEEGAVPVSVPGRSMPAGDSPDEAAPWGRMGAREPGAPPPASPRTDPHGPGHEDMDQDGPPSPLPDGSRPDSVASVPSAPPVDDYWAVNPPSEAVAGDDSVRDIWARLQAMGGQAKQSPLAAPAGDGKSDTPPSSRTLPIGADTLAPWEQFEHYGVVPAFLATAKNIFLKPGDFFDNLPPVTGKMRSLIFAVAVSVVAAALVLAWHSFGLQLGGLKDLGHTEGFQGLGTGAIGSVALLGLAPVVTVAFVFLDSSIAHLLLGLLRAASRPFEETFRALCYAGAPWLLAVLPLPYSYLIPVVLIWHMTLQAISLKKLHQSGYPQVLASVLVKWSLYFMASFAVLHVLITRR